MTADERRLLRLFRALSDDRRTGLLDYAEYLQSRALPTAAPVWQTPIEIPRPERESVVKAIKRLRATYPMLDRAKLLHEISALMTQHLVHGKPAADVIDDLETLFRNIYRSQTEQ